MFPFDFGHLAQETRTFLAEARDVAEGHLDLGEAVPTADELVGATAALRTALNERSAEEPERANEVLRRLARTPVPLTYASEGRLTHEAADITPMMSTHRASMYPGLDRAFDLAALEGDAHGFLHTKLRRQANRFAESLREAARVAASF